MAKAPQKKTKKPKSDADIELRPDAWERFEKAVDQAGKQKPRRNENSGKRGGAEE